MTTAPTLETITVGRRRISTVVPVRDGLMPAMRTGEG